MSTIHHKVAALCATAIAMGLMGCQFVAGIANEKDRGSTGTGMDCRLNCSAACMPYCEKFFGGGPCKGKDYPDFPSCCAVCGALTESEVMCRGDYAVMGASPLDCVKAGAFSALACGSAHTNFADVFKTICPIQQTASDNLDNEDSVLLAAECQEKANCLCTLIANGTAMPKTSCTGVACPKSCSSN